ncbi:signal peptidase I [Patescibacteria group bacterium]|nr:signal peptidase I [Patescibacteria group bacterium]
MKKENNRPILSFFLELGESLFSSLIVLFLIYKFVAMPEVVHGASMYPNFDTGERILMEKVTKFFKPYERGEVVILNPPGNANIDYLKRIVALPGDIVKIQDCKVYISRYGEKFELQEDYLPDSVCTDSGSFFREGHSVRLFDDEYLVFGDNRGNSVDSRYFGVIKASNIQGRVIFRFWPLNRVGFL